MGPLATILRGGAGWGKRPTRRPSHYDNGCHCREPETRYRLPQQPSPPVTMDESPLNIAVLMNRTTSNTSSNCPRPARTIVLIDSGGQTDRHRVPTLRGSSKTQDPKGK